MADIERKALRSAAAIVAASAMIALAGPPALPAQQAGGPLASLSAPARSAIRAAADSLVADGLPGDALVAKAAEGVLKGADEERIVLVVHHLAADLRAAAAALGSDASPGELVAAAGALRAGASPEVVRQLRAAAGAGAALRRRSLTVALVVVGDLVSRGAPPGVVAGTVTSLLARHASDDDLQALRVAVERDIDAGGEPASAALARSRALADSLGGGTATAAPRGPATAPRTPRP
jgi:hypothetical protein